MKALLVLSASLVLTAIAWASCVLLQPMNPAQKKAAFLHDGKVNCLAFSPDGRYLVGGSSGISEDEAEYWQGRIKVWNVSTLKLVGSLDVPQHVRSLAFSPKNSFLAVGCVNLNDRGSGSGFKAQPGEVHVLLFPKLKEEKKFELSNGFLSQVLFSRNGKFFAASYSSTPAPARSNGHLSVWSVADWKMVRQIEEPREWRIPLSRGFNESSFLSLTRSAEGRRLKQVSEIDPNMERKDDKPLATFDLQNPADNITFLEAFADKRHVLYDWGCVRVLNLENGKDVTPAALGKATTICNAFTVSEDGKWLACAVRRAGKRAPGNGWVVLWDLVGQKQLEAFEWHEELVGLTSIAISPDKKLLAVGTNNIRYTGGKYRRGEVVVFDISKMPPR